MLQLAAPASPGDDRALRDNRQPARPRGCHPGELGFEVDDRFALATGVAGNVVANVAPLSSPNTAFTVRTFIGGSAAANSFYIVVY